MTAAIGGAFDRAQVHRDTVFGSGFTDDIEIAIFNADRLTDIVGVQFFLQGRFKLRTFGAFYPEWIARNQRLAERDQSTAFAGCPANPFDNFGEARVALQPDWRDLRQSDR